MKLAILTAAVWPSAEEACRKLWIFLHSVQKFASGYDLHLYGIGRTFPGYRALCLDYHCEYLKTMSSEYTHILFSDGWDAFFTGPVDEIIGKYQDMGSPDILSSAFFQLGNVSDVEKQYPGCFDQSVRYCFPNRGGYMAKREAIIEAFDGMLRLPRQTGDDAFNWYDSIQEGWFRPKLDSDCRIFQIATDDIEIRDGRIYNRYTKQYPCVWHHSGGYCDPERGKDDRMIPWARQLGILD